MRKRNKALISVGVLLLAAVIVTAFLIPRPSINRIVNGNLLSQCPNQWPPVSPEQESQNVSQREQFGVFLANPGQTATLCVGYTANGFTNSATLQLQSQAVAANTSVFARSISVTAQPSGSIVAPPANNCGLSPCGLSVAYAVYTITVTNATQGFYILELAGMCPQALAVGYSSSEVNATDFSGWVRQIESCSGNPQVSSEIVAFSNLNIGYPYVN
jgi:hypothetical protein